jgi:hypothetical protein
MQSDPAVASFVCFDDAADDVELLFGAVEQGLARANLAPGMTAMRPMPMLKVRIISSCGDLAEGAQVLEDGQHRPGADFDLRGGAFGQDAGQIFGDAAAGDVGHAGGEAGVDSF